MSYVAPWAVATALAVALSWLGVRGVVRGAVSERSAPPPIAGPVIHGSPSTLPGPPTSVGSPTSAPKPATGEDQGPKPSKSPTPSDKPTKPKPSGNVRSFATRGGQAALAFTDGRVKLVSATPNPGYETRVTEAARWLRVDFLSDKHTSSVVATWDRRPPTVKVYEY
ncbi:hypothetical protein [Actinomadura opuntiae]|uniref:hypothetical protein n=1 Tax=Actinomadura sp. OS1-43 TaxID=604315 RepID=UPI00255AA0E7|nr:hypothetical protein [Actinomadura sp. OS1-43]MDL4818920.1 hypothetical protein [Actinomadura sp. OS1-43]